MKTDELKSSDIVAVLQDISEKLGRICLALERSAGVAAAPSPATLVDPADIRHEIDQRINKARQHAEAVRASVGKEPMVFSAPKAKGLGAK